MARRYVSRDCWLDLNDPLTIALGVFLLEAGHEWLSDPWPLGQICADAWSSEW